MSYANKETHPVKNPSSPAPVYLPVVDCTCYCQAHAGDPTYRMTGRCTNCGKSPILGIFTTGHQARGGILGTGYCPVCRVQSLQWFRLAHEYELGE
jgi:hypothetical protein